MIKRCRHEHNPNGRGGVGSHKTLAYCQYQIRFAGTLVAFVDDDGAKLCQRIHAIVPKLFEQDTSSGEKQPRFFARQILLPDVISDLRTTKLDIALFGDAFGNRTNRKSTGLSAQDVPLASTPIDSSVIIRRGQSIQ